MADSKSEFVWGVLKQQFVSQLGEPQQVEVFQFQDEAKRFCNRMYDAYHEPIKRPIRLRASNDKKET